MPPKIIYPVGTVVRLKKTGQFARIEKIVTLLDNSFLHYEGPIEGRGDGHYYLDAYDMELEALPVSEYFMNCPTCGRQVDKRELGQVLSHGVFNQQTGKYECLDDPIDVKGVTANRVA